MMGEWLDWMILWVMNEFIGCRKVLFEAMLENA